MEHPERCTSSPCPHRAGPLVLYALLLLAGATAHERTAAGETSGSARSSAAVVAIETSSHAR